MKVTPIKIAIGLAGIFILAVMLIGGCASTKDMIKIQKDVITISDCIISTSGCAIANCGKLIDACDKGKCDELKLSMCLLVKCAAEVDKCTNQIGDVFK